MELSQLSCGLAIFAAGCGLWYVALSKRARGRAALSVRHVRKNIVEDMETVRALVQGLGVVFGIFSQIIGVGAPVEIFRG